jgi:osmotically-inducible protein OsmY
MVSNRVSMLTGIGIGVGLMYFFDPERGRRRRALARDRLAHARRLGANAVGSTSRDLAHRASGAAARLRRALRREQVDDAVLVERVRSRLGRIVEHPHAVNVTARDGVVALRGSMQKAEVKRLLRAIGRIRGVREVVSELSDYRYGGGRSAATGRNTGAAGGTRSPNTFSTVVGRAMLALTRGDRRRRAIHA